MDVEKCITKECVNYDKDDHNNCMAELDIKICPNHLMEKSEPVAEVPCSVGLEGLVEKWEKAVKDYDNRIEVEGKKGNHDGVVTLIIVRSELKQRLKELNEAL